MKKLLLLLAVTLAFTFTALAQTDTSQTGSTSGQTTTTTKTKTKKSKSTDQTGGAAASDQGAAKTGGKAKKEASLTGCLSAQPDSSGNYTLSNGRYKNGVEVGPTDKVKDHAGHQVQLKGEWKAAAGGETAGGGTKAAAKSFDVASVKHLSDTCKEAAGGGTTGATKKGEKDMKKGKAKGATPPGF